MTCVLFYKCSLRPPPVFSLGSGTLTHSVFTAAGSLSAVFTHITGVKRGRFHNEVQRFMAASIKMLSESRNHSPLWWSRERYQGWSLTEVELSTNLVKWCEVTCTSDALKNLPPLREKYNTHNWRSESQNDWLFFICFAHKKTFYDTLQQWYLNKISTNQFIYSCILSVLILLYCSCPFLTQGNFLLAYWSAALPSNSSLLTVHWFSHDCFGETA